MGTRSLTYIYDNKGQVLCVLYLQFDGYLDGYGANLESFLSEYKFSEEAGKPISIIDMGDLAMKFICNFSKEEFGYGCMISPLSTSSIYHGQEWEYHVYCDKIRVIEIGNKEREVSWEEFTLLCKNGMDGDVEIVNEDEEE